MSEPATLTLSNGREVRITPPKSARALYGIKLAALSQADLGSFAPLVPRIADVTEQEFGDLPLVDAVAVVQGVANALGEALALSTLPTLGS